MDYIRERLKRRATSYIETRHKMLRARVGAEEFFAKYVVRGTAFWSFEERVSAFSYLFCG